MWSVFTSAESSLYRYYYCCNRSFPSSSSSTHMRTKRRRVRRRGRLDSDARLISTRSRVVAERPRVFVLSLYFVNRLPLWSRSATATRTPPTPNSPPPPPHTSPLSTDISLVRPPRVNIQIVIIIIIIIVLCDRPRYACMRVASPLITTPPPTTIASLAYFFPFQQYSY